MKYLLGVLSLVALSYATLDGDIDLSQLKIRRPIRKLNPDEIVYEERIVGGDVVQTNSIPYQAALIITSAYGTYLCGGTLVSPRHVITAAHCLQGASQIQVRLGAHYWNVNEPTQQRIFSTDYIVHPGFDVDLLINDVAVVNLPNDAELNDYVQVATLPSFDDVGNTFVGEYGRVSGWGIISDDTQESSNNLRAVESVIITNTACRISFLGVIVSSHICTSGADGVGGCHGDSGGPLVVGNTLVGVVSFALGLGCETGWPTVYSRTTSFLDWFYDHTDAVISRS